MLRIAVMVHSRQHGTGCKPRLSTRVAAWLVVLIYLIGPFHLHLCFGACVAGEACCQPIEPASCCPGEEAPPPVDACSEDVDCCLDLVSEPPIGVLQNLTPSPSSLPASVTPADTFLEPGVSGVTGHPSSPTTGPPLFILFDVLRR